MAEPEGKTVQDAEQSSDHQDDFDAAYEEFVGQDETSDEVLDDVSDDVSDTDEPEQVAETSTDESPDSHTEATAPEKDSGDEGTATEAEQHNDQPEEDEVEKLRQRVKSAEGRFTKFEENLEEMKEQLRKAEQAGDSGTSDTTHNTEPKAVVKTAAAQEPDQDNSEFVPPGMAKDDWLDLQEDYPDTANMLKEKFQKEQTLEQENRQLKEREAQEAEEQEARKAFRQTILDEHPDYDTAIAPKLDDVKAFIDEQNSAVQQQTYQRIFETGTAEEVSALIKDYKAVRGTSSNPSNPSKTSTDSPPPKKVDDALAVPAKGGSSPNLSKGKVDMDDYDSAYEEALKSDLD